MIIEHLSQGHSISSFAVKINVTRRLLWDWKTRFPDFGEAYAQAVDAALAYWEDKATEFALGEYVEYNAEGKQVGKRPSGNMIQFIMKQRFYAEYNKVPAQEVTIIPNVTYKTKMSEDGRPIQDVLEDIQDESGEEI